MSSFDMALFSALHEIEEQVRFQESIAGAPSDYILGRWDSLRILVLDLGLVKKYERWTKK